MIKRSFIRLRMILSILPLALHAGPAAAVDSPRWFADGRPTAQSIHAIRLLAAAAEDGLDPDDYQAGTIARMLEEADHGKVPTASAQAAVSDALTLSVVQLIQDMHKGRVEPGVVQASYHLPVVPMDAPAYLRDAVRGGRLPEAIDALRHGVPHYAALRQALINYRALEHHAALRHPLPPLPNGHVGIGQAYPGLAQLTAKLVALGDLPDNTRAGLRYDPALSGGISAFQERHGLTPDGILGPRTLAQLDTPVAMRTRQIELTMERLRWTPLPPGRRIVVNLPEFALHAHDGRTGEPAISMRAVIGRAQGARTPLFSGEVRQVEFNPYWNIPPPIARNEILPAVLQDPALFIRQGLEFVGADGTVIDSISQPALEMAIRESWRLRQRPGPANPLGRIKFLIPGPAGIHLHDTPSVHLFLRSRRDFSHGCIRVQDPVALAHFVLGGQPGWDYARIMAAMESGTSLAMRIHPPVPVTVTYASAVVKRNGKVHFYADVYGNDRLLDAALRAREMARRAPSQPLPTAARMASERLHGRNK